MAPSASTVESEYVTTSTFRSTHDRHCDRPENCSFDGSFDARPGTELGRVLMRNVLRQRVEHIDTDTCQPGQEDAFFVADMGEVYRQHLRWKLKLQRVKPHYAVKCNPDPEVLRLLAALDTGFDCASKTEIEQVLALGVDPSRIIYAQPCKNKSYIRYAAQQRVKQMTFDNSSELYKTRTFFPDAELFLRILTDDSKSSCRLSPKFGASLGCTKELLGLAKALDLNVVGVSFHIGSGASDPQSFAKAVQDSRQVFDQAEELGFKMTTLDVGGGFSGDLFDDMAQVLSEALDQYFPSTIRVIGEPGRYFVASAFSLACNIIARREIYDPLTALTSYMIYINDGVYGNFSNIIFDHQHPTPRILRRQSQADDDDNDNDDEDEDELTDYSIWGPSCDGIDRIVESCSLNGILDVGDWLFFEDMGAYSKCSATRFNGFTNDHDVLYISSEPGASALLNY